MELRYLLHYYMQPDTLAVKDITVHVCAINTHQSSSKLTFRLSSLTRRFVVSCDKKVSMEYIFFIGSVCKRGNLVSV